MMTSLDFHFINRFHQQAQKLSLQPATRFLQNGKWVELNWVTLQKHIDELSYALLASGIGVQDKVAIFAQNMPRWTIADIGTMQIRAISVPIYATNTAKQVEYILNDADIKILFVGDQEQYDIAIEIANKCPLLQKIVAMKQSIKLRDIKIAQHWQDFINVSPNDTELNQRLNDKRLDDLFTLIYTSGTTGEPKGVMLDYANLAYQLQAHDKALPNIDENDVSLSFLPLSHIFERAWVYYVLHRGAINCYLEDPHQVRDALTALKPTLMCAVPRFYEKIYAAIWDKVNQAPSHRQTLFNWAIRSAQSHLLGKKTTF